MSRPQLVPLNIGAFTSAPTLPALQQGDVYFNKANNGVYVYDGTAWSQINRANGFLSVSATTPLNPNSGDMWFDTTSNLMLVYSSGSWVGVVGNNPANSNPVDIASSWWLGA